MLQMLYEVAIAGGVPYGQEWAHSSTLAMLSHWLGTAPVNPELWDGELLVSFAPCSRFLKEV